jgi:hypothetical protein
MIKCYKCTVLNSQNNFNKVTETTDLNLREEFVIRMQVVPKKGQEQTNSYQ